MTTHAAVLTDPRERGLGIYDKKVGMWVFLCSEVMFFTGLIGSYIILRFGAAGEWPTPGEVLNVPVTALNTFFLICSSVTMVKAFAAIEDGDQRGLRLWLIATVLIGSTFVGIQAYEYSQLVHHGFLPSGYRPASELAEAVAAGEIPGASGSLYGATFYSMTGFHGFHVTCGVVALTWVAAKAFRGGYTREDHQGVEIVGLYWHFVDLVWIILFTIVYLI